MNKRRIVLFLPLFIVVCWTTCSYRELLDRVNIQKPEVDFERVTLSDLSFDAVDLLFSFTVRNPNAIGVQLAGFDYDFEINGNAFISGKNDQGLSIPARRKNTVRLPVSLRFKEIFQSYQSIARQDSSAYKLSCAFSFEVPILGIVKIPVSKEGRFPVLKMPSVVFDGLKLQRLNFPKAELTLRLKLNNPNAFNLHIHQVDYQLAISDKQWLRGTRAKGLNIENKKTSVLEIPFSLDFIQIGQSVYQLVAGNTDLNYRLNGNLDFSTSIRQIGNVGLEFDQSGKVRIAR